jgi:hypothetical protein
LPVVSRRTSTGRFAHCLAGQSSEGTRSAEAALEGAAKCLILYENPANFPYKRHGGSYLVRLFQAPQCRFGSRNRLETEGGAEVVDGKVDLTEGGSDLAVVGGLGLRGGSGDEGGERSVQASAELDQEDAELEAACGEAVAASATNPLDEAVSPELAEVVPELTEAVTVEQAYQDVAGGPVGDEAAGMEQYVEQADHAIVLQTEARHATLSDLDRLGETGQLTLIDGAGEQLSLGIEEALIGLGHVLDQRRQVLEAAADVE